MIPKKKKKKGSVHVHVAAIGQANTNRFDVPQTKRFNKLAIRAASVKIWTIIFASR